MMTGNAKKHEFLHCNDCRNKTQHRVLKTVKRTSEPDPDYWWQFTYDMMQCCGCSSVTLREGYVGEDDPDEQDIRYFPPRISRHPPIWRHSLPHKIKKVLNEIYRSLDADNTVLPMTGARTILDIVIVEKVGDVGTFNEKLARLKDQGLLTGSQVQILDAALDAGHAAAHRGHEPEYYEIKLVMDIIENLLQTLYVLPKNAETLRNITPARPLRK